MPACGLPIFAKRSGIVNIVKSAGSQLGTSYQRSGAETRASGCSEASWRSSLSRTRNSASAVRYSGVIEPWCKNNSISQDADLAGLLSVDCPPGAVMVSNDW
jgi:hypothetical protein